MEVIYCCYKATKVEQKEYCKRMHEVWQQRGNDNTSEQRLADQKRQIFQRSLLTEAELQIVKAATEAPVPNEQLGNHRNESLPDDQAEVPSVPLHKDS